MRAYVESLERELAARQKMTQRQQDVLAYIKRYLAAEGRSPSFPEISQHFGWASANGASTAVEALVARGYLRRGYNRRRGIEVVEQ